MGKKTHNRLERSDSNHVQKVNFTLDTSCKSSHIYTGLRGHQVGLGGAGFVPIRLVPLSLVVSRTLVSLPFRTGVG